MYAGLLAEAHEKGLEGIDTELVQTPTEENGQVAICKATVVIREPTGSVDPDTGEPVFIRKTFTGLGDASPNNVSRNIVPHIIRMAETRSKARALRDGVNIGMTSLEELSGDDEAASAPTPLRGSAPKPSQASEKAPERPREAQVDLLEGQVELLRTLATELRGKNGVARLEERIGKTLAELSRHEADKWIAKLEPAGKRQEA